MSIALFGCNLKIDNKENSNEGIQNEKEAEKEALKNNENESNSKDEVEDRKSNLVLNTLSTETVIRKVEGMDEEFKVIQYQIQPYNISYRLDETFGVPKVKDNEITYSNQNDEYKII